MDGAYGICGQLIEVPQRRGRPHVRTIVAVCDPEPERRVGYPPVALLIVFGEI